MAETFSKKEKEKKKQQKKKEKEQRKNERKANAKSGQSLEDMMAYVDENGNISSTPPDPNKKQVINENEIVLGSRNIEGMVVKPYEKGPGYLLQYLQRVWVYPGSQNAGKHFRSR